MIVVEPFVSGDYMNHCVPKCKAMHSAGAVITLVIPREGPLGERGWGLVELWEQGKKWLLGRSSIGRGLGTAAALHVPEAWCSAGHPRGMGLSL